MTQFNTETLIGIGTHFFYTAANSYKTFNVMAGEDKHSTVYYLYMYIRLYLSLGIGVLFVYLRVFIGSRAVLV